MNLTQDNAISKWVKGIPYEVAFWNNVFRWKHTFNGMMGWSNYGGKIELEDFDANSFLLGLYNPIVLDVGCGMSYAPGNNLSVNGQLCAIDIHYVDSLATYFNTILKRHRRNLPAIEFGMMEYLSDFYPSNSVDLVIIQNALDHSSAPIKGIIESLHILKHSGVLYLNHHLNEAETEHYKGFHQFNIMQEAGNLIIWNNNSRHNINDLLKSCADVTVNYDNATDHVTAVIRKTHDVPDALLQNSDRKALSMSLIKLNEKQGSISTALAMKLRYWRFNTIQFFAQALPWNIKMRVKKIIGQK